MARRHPHLLAILGLSAIVTLSACGKSDLAEVTPGKESNVSGEVGMTPEAEGNPYDGSLEAGKYKNEYFGFTISFPVTWAVISPKIAQVQQERETEVMSGDVEILKSSLKAAAKTQPLLIISEQPQGTPTASFNPSIVVQAKKVPHVSGIISGAKYLQLEMDYLRQKSNLPYTQIGTPYEVEIGGRKFHRVDLTLTSSEIEISQSYLATIEKSYALSLMLSGTKDTMGRLEEIAESIEF